MDGPDLAKPLAVVAKVKVITIEYICSLFDKYCLATGSEL